MRRSFAAFAPKTPRQIIGVSPTASFEEIKERFRVLVREHHPDTATGDAHKFREINAAYSILRHELKGGKPFSPSPAGEKSSQAKPSSSGGTHSRYYQTQKGGAPGSHNAEDRFYSRHADPSYSSESKGEREAREADRAAFWDYMTGRSRRAMTELALILITLLSSAMLFLKVVVQGRAELRRLDREREATKNAVMPQTMSEEDLARCSFPVDETLKEKIDSTEEHKRLRTKFAQRRFEDFREYLLAFDPDHVGERNVSVHRLVSDAVDEPLVHERCRFVRGFNTDVQSKGYDAAIMQLTQQILGTKWENVDTPDAAVLALNGVSRVSATNPHRAKWTFIEYKRVDPITRKAIGTTECVAAIRNERVLNVGEAQRVVITGHETLQMGKLKQRRLDMSRGSVTPSDLVSGGITPIKESFR